MDRRRPPAMLSDLVAGFWIDQRQRTAAVKPAWRIVADDAAHLIYTRERDAGGSERHRLHVVGPRRQFVDVDRSRRILTICARLQPGALPVLFGVPAWELTDRSVPAELLVRRPVHRTMALLEGAGPEVVLARLTDLVQELATCGPAVDPRSRLLREHELAGSTVRAVASRFGVTERGLRAWSATHVGLGLRRCLRIRRLHRALLERSAEPRATWSSVAARVGFADQPHLVRDCRSLLGESPSQFMARAG